MYILKPKDALAAFAPYGVLELSYQRHYQATVETMGPEEMGKCYDEKGTCTVHGYFSFLHYVYFDFFGRHRIEVCLLIKETLVRITRGHRFSREVNEMILEMFSHDVWLD